MMHGNRFQPRFRGRGRFGVARCKLARCTRTSVQRAWIERHTSYLIFCCSYFVCFSSVQLRCLNYAPKRFKLCRALHSVGNGPLAALLCFGLTRKSNRRRPSQQFCPNHMLSITPTLAQHAVVQQCPPLSDVRSCLHLVKLRRINFVQLRSRLARCRRKTIPLPALRTFSIVLVFQGQESSATNSATTPDFGPPLGAEWPGN